MVILLQPLDKMQPAKLKILFLPMELPTYLQQTINRNKQDLIKAAIAYYWQLIEENHTKNKAKEIVLKKLGVVL